MTIKAALILATVMMVALIGADAAFECSTVTADLVSCLPFLKGNDAKPTPVCCNGVKSLNAAAKTTPDRQAACQCIKSTAQSYHINSGKANQLPTLCKVNVGVPISSSVDCTKIH
eukprot:Gb_19513 [translate_table: standard]